MQLTELKVVLDELVEKWDLNDHKFFSRLDNDGITLEQFSQIMAPFYFAVYFWHDHLNDFYHILLTHKIIDCHLIKENVMDELGFTDGIRHYEKCHTATYINFLHSIGFCDKMRYTAAVQKFVLYLTDLMKNGSPRYNAYVLGAIEYFYIFISNSISKYCNRYEIKQEHFELHEEIDMKHSMDFFQVGMNCKNIDDPEMKEILNVGFKLIWDIFEELYLEL